MRGGQISGAVNFAHGLHGAQVGVLNISGDVSGAQVGVVNLAWGKVNGAQVGVVNLANTYESGAPVGLLSLVKDASYHFELWSSDLNPINLSLRVDLNQRFYTLLNAASSGVVRVLLLIIA